MVDRVGLSLVVCNGLVIHAVVWIEWFESKQLLVKSFSVVFLGKTLNSHSASLYPGVYRCVPEKCQGTPPPLAYSFQERV